MKNLVFCDECVVVATARSNFGPIENTGYPSGVPNWDIYLCTQKKTILSTLLIQLTKVISNQNNKKSKVRNFNSNKS